MFPSRNECPGLRRSSRFGHHTLEQVCEIVVACTIIQLHLTPFVEAHGGHHFDGMVTAARNFLSLAYKPDAASYALTRVPLAPVDSSR